MVEIVLWKGAATVWNSGSFEVPRTIMVLPL